MPDTRSRGSTRPHVSHAPTLGRGAPTLSLTLEPTPQRGEDQIGLETSLETDEAMIFDIKRRQLLFPDRAPDASYIGSRNVFPLACTKPDPRPRKKSHPASAVVSQARQFQ